MNKFKQCTYTVILMLTCFVASPLIFHKIWKSSSEATKPVNVPPPVVDHSSGESSVPAPENSESSAPDATGPGEVSDVPDSQPGEVSQPDVEFNPPEQTPHFVQADPSYFDNALFIGDSRTVGIQDYGTLKNADYFCSVGLSAAKINNETINGRTFEQLIDGKQYGKVYVMLGINEVGNDIETTATAYRAIIERIKVHQPNAVIYVQGNLHVSLSASTSVINNDNINYLNSLIAAIADNSRVFYIDINELYDDEHGDLTESYTSDGIHPLAEYYKQWCEWLCTKTVSFADNTAEAPAQ